MGTAPPSPSNTSRPNTQQTALKMPNPLPLFTVLFDATDHVSWMVARFVSGVLEDVPWPTLKRRIRG